MSSTPVECDPNYESSLQVATVDKSQQQKIWVKREWKQEKLAPVSIYVNLGIGISRISALESRKVSWTCERP